MEHKRVIRKENNIMISVVENPQNINEVSFNQRKGDLELQKQAEVDEIKRLRKSPFSNFYQINKKHSDDLMWLVSANPNAYRILLFLLDHMDKYNAVICSYTVIQEALDLSRSTASRAVRLLKEHGFIHIMRSGTSNVYIVNNDLAWNSWGNNMQYCEFPANVIISASEQDKRSSVVSKRITTVEVKKSVE